MPLTTPPVGSIPLYARSKVTGETYLVGPSTTMIDDLGDVDTSTTGPTGGSSLVWNEALGQWVPGPGGLTISTDLDNEVMLGTDGGLYSNEVHLGATGPTLSGPDLWADPEAGVLYAAATGPTGATEWVPVGASEVEVSPIMPTGTWELWVDEATELLPSSSAATSNEVAVGSIDPYFTDPDSTVELWYDEAAVATSSPGVPSGGAAGAPLVKETADSLDTRWGGDVVMTSGAVIDFPNATGPKIITYGDTTTGFGLGVESGETSLFASTKVGFHKDASNGTLWGSVDANGFTANGVWVPTLKVINNVALVVGHYYEISTVAYHRTVRFRIGVIGPGKPTRAQSLDGLAALLADAGEGESLYDGYINLYGHVKGSQVNNKLFDQIAVGPEKLWLRCSQASTVQVGIEAYDTASGARTTLSFGDAGTGVNSYGEVAL